MRSILGCIWHARALACEGDAEPYSPAKVCRVRTGAGAISFRTLNRLYNSAFNGRNGEVQIQVDRRKRF